MTSPLERFERIVRSVGSVGKNVEVVEEEKAHPFDERNMHAEIVRVSRRLFDDGHYAQATFEAYKLLDNIVSNLSGIEDTGFSLMMNAFNETAPKIVLTDMKTMSEKDVQKGFRHIFAGSMSGVRNPLGHDIRTDPVGLCLDHLSLASVLMRTLDVRKAP